MSVDTAPHPTLAPPRLAGAKGSTCPALEPYA
jgi:hypothetical protein